ncbi:unnamed protein product [Arabidopsis halleri]
MLQWLHGRLTTSSSSLKPWIKLKERRKTGVRHHLISTNKLEMIDRYEYARKLMSMCSWL